MTTCSQLAISRQSEQVDWGLRKSVLSFHSRRSVPCRVASIVSGGPEGNQYSSSSENCMSLQTLHNFWLAVAASTACVVCILNGGLDVSPSFVFASMFVLVSGNLLTYTLH